MFSRSRGYLTLVVEGLPDGQPNLMIGDEISVSVNSHMHGPSYKAYIHDVCSINLLYILYIIIPFFTHFFP